MPVTEFDSSKQHSSTPRWYDVGADLLGFGWVKLEVVLILVAFTVWLFFWIAGAPNSLPSSLIFTLCIGNWSSVLLNQAQPLFVPRRLPWNWIIFVLLVLVVGISGSVLAKALVLLVLVGPNADFFRHPADEAPIGTLVTLVFGVVNYLFEEQKTLMDRRNQQLQGQVQLGQLKEQSHVAELEQAHEIQRHLLPQETPQLPGFQIACAWQPAKSVSGDYFDVLSLTGSRLGLCIADVSGKGITAALLMANLQASVKAFAPEAASPAALCAKLNAVLCETVAPGKFVTFFYAVIDASEQLLRYENAGHCLPLLVRGDGSIVMPASYSGVLGLFSHWTFQDSTLQLERGDCLVLMTDGVLEAANSAEEEFGYQRLIEVVKKSRQNGVHAVRTAILDAVSSFCAGRFDDDASLIVVTVDQQ